MIFLGKKTRERKRGNEDKRIGGGAVERSGAARRDCQSHPEGSIALPPSIPSLAPEERTRRFPKTPTDDPSKIKGDGCPRGDRKPVEFVVESLRVKAAAALVRRSAVSEMGSCMSRGRRRGFGGGASGGMLPLLALQVLIEYGRAGASRPPVTAALLAANALIYLRPGALDGILPSVTRVSFNPRLIIEVPILTYLSIAQLENEIPVILYTYRNPTHFYFC